YQSLLRDQDTKDGRLAPLDKEQRAASEADDIDTVIALGKERKRIEAELDELRKHIEVKATAIQATRRLIAEAQRAAHVAQAKAHIATLQDIAPALEQSVFDTVDFVRRFTEQLQAAERAMKQLGGASGYTNVLPSTTAFAAWLVNQLVDGCSLPVRAEFTERGMVVQPQRAAPVDLAAEAASIVETTR
ncbi:MAG: hypothetical protein ACRDGB_15935, partial [Candidatus Limnocylindria bacterium]